METNHTATLRSLAEQRGIYFGAAASARALRTDYAYREMLAREFNLLVPECEMTFAQLSPRPGAYDFGPAEELVDFAYANDMHVRGRHLVCHKANPDWLKEGNYNRRQALDLLYKHIFTVMGHFHGQMVAWDVVTGCIDSSGGLRDSFWLHTIGADYIDYAFRWANEADPKAHLFINDTCIEGIGPKADSLYSLVADLLKRGTPIHGVGMQMHLAMNATECFSTPPAVAELVDNMKRLADLGIDLHITEMDVHVQGLPGSPREQFEKQARIYEDVLHTALRNPRLKAFVLSGLTDRYALDAKNTGQQDSPLIFDEYYQPKPAFEALYRVLEIT